MIGLAILMVSLMLAALVACWRVPSGAWRLRDVLLASISLGLSTETLALLVHHLSRNNCIVYNVCVPFEFLLLLWLIFRFRPQWRTSLAVAAVIGCLAMVVDGRFRDPFMFLLTEGVVVIAAVLTVVLLAALWSLAGSSWEPLPKVPEFWLFMGLLVYFGGMVPYIGMLRFVFRQNEDLAAKLFVVMPALCIARYALITAACIIQARRMRSLRHG